MEEVLVRDIDGNLCSPTTLARAKKAKARGRGRIVKDREGNIWLELQYIADLGRAPAQKAPSANSANAKKRRSRIAHLRERDGDHCFYCLALMQREEMTMEHLLSQKFKGSNSVQNLVLAHLRCNELAGHLSIAEKVRLREQRLAERLRFLKPEERREVLGALHIPPLPLPR